MSRLPVPEHSHPAHARVSFYSALSGYVEEHDPSPEHYLVAGPVRSPDSWLEIASELISKIPEASEILYQVQQLVREHKYQKAREIIRLGTQQAEKEIRSKR